MGREGWKEEKEGGEGGEGRMEGGEGKGGHERTNEDEMEQKQ